EGEKAMRAMLEWLGQGGGWGLSGSPLASSRISMERNPHPLEPFTVKRISAFLLPSPLEGRGRGWGSFGAPSDPPPPQPSPQGGGSAGRRFRQNMKAARVNRSGGAIEGGKPASP